MTHADLIERITRSLAYMLRHQPEEFDLELDAQGFGDLDEVVRALSERLGEDIDVEDVEQAIASGDRPRYEIVEDRVRALYGHSIDVDPGEPAQPPELLYVGINSRDARRAVQYGLRGGRRRFLHLARTLEDARETGRRTGVDYSVLTVHAVDAWEDGVNFYDRQALFLAEQIPTEFLEIAETRDDGFEREPRRGDGDRGHGRDRDRDRDRGRGGRGGRGRGRGGRGEGRRRDEGDRGRHDRERDAGSFGRDEERPERSDREPARAGDRGGRGRDRGDRERSDRSPRSDRGDGDRGGRRSEREPRRDSESRREREPRPEPRRSEPVERGAGTGAASEGGFGLGVFEPRAHAARPEPERAPRQAPAKRPEPPAREREPVDDSPGFGAGL